MACGGAIGSLVRYAVSLAIGSPAHTAGFPVATLAINLLGALLLGALAEAARERGTPRWQRARLVLGTGVLGGFTTYSLLAADLAEAALGGRFGIAFGYAAATLIGGVLLSGVGMLAGRRIGRGGPGPALKARSDVR